MDHGEREVTCFARGSVRHEDQSVREKRNHRAWNRCDSQIRAGQYVRPPASLIEGKLKSSQGSDTSLNHDRFQGVPSRKTTRTLKSLLGEGRFAIHSQATSFMRTARPQLAASSLRPAIFKTWNVEVKGSDRVKHQVQSHSLPPFIFETTKLGNEYSPLP